MDNKKIRVSAWDLHQDKLEDLIIKLNPKEIEFFWMLEYDFNVTDSLIKFINDNKIKVKIISCAGDLALFSKQIYSRLNVEHTKVEVWPTFWINYSHFRLLNENPSFYALSAKPKNFKNPFLTFNGKDRLHRVMLIDSLKKHNLLDKGIVTLHRLYKNTNIDKFFKHHDGSVITGPDDFSSHESSYRFNNSFLESFLHIPTETSTEMFMISEKTATPMLCKLPFLVLGSPGYHQRLKKLGFEIYDEIFDYSFDEEFDTEKRIEKLMYNIDYINKNRKNLNLLYEKIKPKIEKNYQMMKEYVTGFKYLPHSIKEFYFELENSNNECYKFSDIEYILYDISSVFKDKKIKRLSNITLTKLE